MGSNFISNVGIEREKIGVDSRWLCSPSMASLDMPSLSLSKCPSKGIGFEKLLKRSLLEKIQTICTKRSLMKREVYAPPKIIGKDFQG
jgi:hypothetical protein